MPLLAPFIVMPVIVPTFVVYPTSFESYDTLNGMLDATAHSCSKFTASDKSVPGAMFLTCCPYTSSASPSTIYIAFDTTALLSTSCSYSDDDSFMMLKSTCCATIPDIRSSIVTLLPEDSFNMSARDYAPKYTPLKPDNAFMLNVPLPCDTYPLPRAYVSFPFHTNA